MNTNIFLDLDNTVICSISLEEEKEFNERTGSPKRLIDSFRWEVAFDMYRTFERPRLQDFLDYLFSTFRVSVWTAASKDYALFVIEKFILVKPNRRLDYLLFDRHCRESKRETGYHKNFSMLPKFGVTYDLSKTYIIDDHWEVYKAQPTNCIRIKTFEILDEDAFEDDELEKAVIPCLKQILCYINN